VALSSADAGAAAVAAALAPYAWRSFTDAMLARRALGAVDQHVVANFVSTVSGADVGVGEPPEPADPGDERVRVVVRMLEGRRWRRISLDRLCADIMSSLAVWQAERDLFHSAAPPVEDS
jgi:hypothetical protein